MLVKLCPLLLLLLMMMMTQAQCQAPGPGPAPSPSAPAVLYLPLGGGGAPSCQPAAGAKLTQLVPLMFAGMTFTIFDAVANINNRINSNNNNNNNDNINFQQSVNTVVSGNINVANQINVMNVAGRRRRDTGTAPPQAPPTRGITPEMKSQAAAIAKHGFEALVTLNRSVGDEKFLEQLNKRLLYYDAMY